MAKTKTKKTMSEEEIELKEIALDEFNEISLFNPNGKNDKIFIFKDKSDLKKAFVVMQENYIHAESQLALIDKNVDEMCLIQITNYLLKNYKKVVFMYDHECKNFDTASLGCLAIKVDNMIYQSNIADYLSYEPNALSLMVNFIKIEGARAAFGKQFCIYEGFTETTSKDEKEKVYFDYQNMIIVLWKQYFGHKTTAFTKVLTNYSIKITKEYEHIDTKGLPVKDLEIEITDVNKNKINIILPAKDKNSLNAFRKYAYPHGNLFDCMTNQDYTRLLNKLCDKKEFDTVKIYNKPGLIQNEKAWLMADEVIIFEDEKGENNEQYD